MNTLHRILTGSILLAVCASSADAIVIDFNDNTGIVYSLPTVWSDGYVATEDNNEYGGRPMGTSFSINEQGPSNGTMHLNSYTNYSSDSVWTLTNQAGHPFNLLSFDFANGFLSGTNTVSSLAVTGTKTDGTTVTTVFSISQIYFQTLTVSSDFNNLVSVTFDAYGLKNVAAYDNINVSDVPVPGALVLFMSGLAGLFSTQRFARK